MSAAPPGLLPDVVKDSSALRPDLLDFFYGFEQLIPDLDHHPDRGIGFSGLFHHGLKIPSLARSKIFLGLLGSHREGVDRFELIAENISKFFQSQDWADEDVENVIHDDTENARDIVSTN